MVIGLMIIGLLILSFFASALVVILCVRRVRNRVGKVTPVDTPDGDIE